VHKLLLLGTKVRSLRDRTLLGTIVGTGVLNQAGPDYSGLGFAPTVVYLVWCSGVVGSSSLGPAIRAFDVEFTEEIE